MVIMHVFYSLNMSSTLSTSETRINNRVASILAKLPNNLEPDALLGAFSKVGMSLLKGDLDDDTLGHAYYTLYYGRVKPTSASVIRSTSSSLLALYTSSATTAAAEAINVVKQTDPAVYVESVCDAILPHIIIPVPLFCQVIRNVHPHELKNDYYHLPNICGFPFDTYLEMVNARLQEYFTANRSLDDILSGIKKCLCLRILSNNMYHYRDNPAGLDPAIQKLMRFYTLTGFLHPSSQAAFGSHAHMILKYKQLKELLEEFIKPEFKHFLRVTKCTSGVIIRVEPGVFDVRIRDGSGTMYELPRTLQMLQAFVASRYRPVPPRMSSSDMVHKVQSHFLDPRIAFDEGIWFMNVLMNRIKKGELSLESAFDDLHKIYKLTKDAFLSLREYNIQSDDDIKMMKKMMKKMVRYIRKKSDMAGPARSPSPLTRKRSRSRSRSPSRSEKRPRNGGGVKSKTRRSKS